jgi:putative lipoprotein
MEQLVEIRVKRSAQLICIALVLLLAMACASEGLDEPAADAEQGARIYRGHALHGHEVRVFRPCGSDDQLWAIDPSGLLWDQYKRLLPDPASGQEIFAVVEALEVPAPEDGFGADYPGALRVESVLYAGLEGPGCDLDWNAFVYRVNGNEPFWSVVVTNGDMRLSRLGAEGRNWAEIGVERIEGGFRYIAGSNGVELTITSEPCLDSMSGSYYASMGIMRVDGEELHGCALKGRP